MKMEKKKQIKKMKQWAKFMRKANAICRSHQHKESMNGGTFCSCSGCSFDVNKFGEHNVCGCVLSTPEHWDEPMTIGYVLGAMLQETEGGNNEKV